MEHLIRTAHGPQKGFVFLSGKGIIYYGSKPQRLTAQSTSESELVALAHITKEGQHVSLTPGRNWSSKAITSEIRADNMGSIFLAEGRRYSPRTEHFSVRFHVLRQMIAEGVLKLTHVRSENQLSDVLTKFMSRHILRSAISAIELYQGH